MDPEYLALRARFQDDAAYGWRQFSNPPYGDYKGRDKCKQEGKNQPKKSQPNKMRRR